MIELFRASTADERRLIADRLGHMARQAGETLPVPVPAYDFSDQEQAILASRIAPIVSLDDGQLDALNSLLPWGAMTGEGTGRVVGSPWSGSKRSRVQPLIDRRIAQFDEAYALNGRHVLEVGCFEGIHTIGCLALGAQVTAVDVRMENVLKTLARLWVYGFQADVRVWNLEAGSPPDGFPSRWDMLHHIGVLYHLTNPAEHLALALERTDAAVMLDTHVAEDEANATESYAALGRTFAYSRKDEVPISPFAGVRDHARWLLVEDLEWICRDRGFTDISIREVRKESNGKRVLLWAFRPGVRVPIVS